MFILFYFVKKGVKFRILGSHLNIEVRVTPFNFMTGNLSLSQSHWIANDNTESSKIQRFVFRYHYFC